LSRTPKVSPQKLQACRKTHLRRRRALSGNVRLIESDCQGSTSKLQAYRRDLPATSYRSRRQHEDRSGWTPKASPQSIIDTAERLLRGCIAPSGKMRFDKVELVRYHPSDQEECMQKACVKYILISEWKTRSQTPAILHLDIAIKCLPTWRLITLRFTVCTVRLFGMIFICCFVTLLLTPHSCSSLWWYS
jgi:hypothetical protein